MQELAGQLTHVVEADSTDEQALRQLSVHEFDRVVIAIGNDLEASILTASLVLRLRGAEHLGEGDQRSRTPGSSPSSACTTWSAPNTTWANGSRTWSAAGCWTTSSSTRTSRWPKPPHPPRSSANPSARPNVRREHGITVVAVKPPGEDFTYATAETVLRAGRPDHRVRRHHDVERFTDLT